MLGEFSAKQAGAVSSLGESDERECCGASVSKMGKQQGGEERAAHGLLRDQGQRRQLRHTVSERNVLRMEGR